MKRTYEKVKIDPKTFKIIVEKTFLFYNFWGIHSMTDRNIYGKPLITKADQHWKKIDQSTPNSFSFV